MNAAGRVSALDVGQQKPVLARVVRRGRRRVAAVVGRQNQQVAGRSASSRSYRRRSKSWRQRWKLTGSLRWPQSESVSTRLVKIEAVVDLSQQPLGLLDPLDVRLRRIRLVDVAAGEDVRDLADAVHDASRLADERQVVRPFRLEREVVAVRGALVVRRARPMNGRAITRPTACLPVRISRAVRQAVVELLERHRLLVRGDLKDASRRTCTRSTCRSAGAPHRAPG